MHDHDDYRVDTEAIEAEIFQAASTSPEDEDGNLYDAILDACESLNLITFRGQIPDHPRPIRQRSHYGLARGLVGQFNQAARDYMDAIHHRKIEWKDEAFDRMQRLWNDFSQLDLTKSARTERLREILPELVESLTVEAIWSRVRWDLYEEPAPLLYPGIFPLANDVIDWQEWFAGIIDAVSEIGGWLNQTLTNPDLTLDQRIELRENFINVANDVEAALRKFETLPGYVTGTGRFREWPLKKKVARQIGGTVRHQAEKLIDILDRQAASHQG